MVCAANEPLLGMAVVVNGMGSMFSLLAYAERERQREREQESERATHFAKQGCHVKTCTCNPAPKNLTSDLY